MMATATRPLAGFAYERTDAKDEWLTPPSVINALGVFDLDPCSPINRPWETALSHYTINDNGLALPWHGRVWMNPPYGDQTELWMQRLAEHGNGIALIFARTETATFFPWVWSRADAVRFLRGRHRFFDVSGKESDSGIASSVLVAYGKDNADALARCGLDGKYVPLT